MSAKTNKVLLEVDRGLLEKKLMIEEPHHAFAAPNEELERLFPTPERPEQPCKIIQLKPGICVKARATSGEKVFLNLCTSEEIPQTKDVSEIELAQILNSDDPSTFRVPMSLGEGRFEKDKSGQQCQVFDIAIHPKTLQKVENNELFRQFILTAAMEGVQNKYNVALKIGEVTILTKRKSIGTPKSQRIRSDGPSTPAGPLISEICPAQANDLKPRTRVPKYKITGEPAKGKLQTMVAELTLPEVASSAELTADIGEDRILVQAHKSNYKLDVFLPHLVDQDAVTAQFDRDSKILTLWLPVKRVLAAGQ
ncbi:PIH1 domain-containing protein 1 [Neocloeon triangulifer]|uniref:PIH1 domain-containing protein 1 n=1 Tax=Neocloeon triangulifer TaxID=2078957 RepID=UPI00286EEAB7|nr:PIH1 domain-containing protein 1 [Neocloeon triangulifer]